MWTALALLASGCLSDKPGSSSLASVTILGATLPDIRDKTEKVFTDEGYHVAEQSETRMAFEHEGTQKDRVLYGRYDEDLTMRVVVMFTPYHQDGFLLRADAEALSGSFSKPQKVMRIARRPYQEMLDRVRTSLAPTPIMP